MASCGFVAYLPSGGHPLRADTAAPLSEEDAPPSTSTSTSAPDPTPPDGYRQAWLGGSPDGLVLSSQGGWVGAYGGAA